ncbi:MAG: carbohydrate kinase family protein [bacterium]|nr:carbohydrate kinase family protein [bacterium]
MKKILVTGSIAYDHLLSFDGKFSDSIIAEQLKNLSVSFTANSHHSDFGGCGANIAYNLMLLGESPLLFAVVGNDFDRYGSWLKKNDISIEELIIDENYPCAQAFVLTDKENNQIAIFSPAAMAEHKVEIELKNEDFSLLERAILSPENPARMLYLAKYFSENSLPFIFDPGQAIPVLPKESLSFIIQKSSGVILNDYEGEILMQKLGLTLEESASDSGFLIRTLGADGCELFENGKVVKTPTYANTHVVDVTGCGDAFRAGLLHGLSKEKSLTNSCAVACAVASFAAEKEGTQNHTFNDDEMYERLKTLLS